MILEGTTSSGAVVPVQVTDDGKVVAEGRTGPEGPQGPEGPEGPQGPEGPAGAPGNLWSGSDPGPISYTGGLVGIGTTSPGEVLDVNGGVRSATASDSRFLLRVNDVNKGGLQATTDAGVVIYGASSTNPIRFQTSGSEKAQIDTAGRLLVGTSGYTAVGSGATLQVKGDGAAASSMSLIRTAAGGPEFHFAAGSSGTNIGNNNGLGFCKFLGYHTNGYDEYARIQAFVDGSNGDGDAPGRLVFSTSGPGSATPTERMRIDSQGDVIFQGAPIIRSPDGNHWAIEVDNNGTLSAIPVL